MLASTVNPIVMLYVKSPAIYVTLDRRFDGCLDELKTAVLANVSGARFGGVTEMSGVPVLEIIVRSGPGKYDEAFRTVNQIVSSVLT